MLICVAGRGLVSGGRQRGAGASSGDVVNIPANVKHWHGAAKDCWFQHLAIEVQGEDGKTEWCEAVTDDAYCKLP